MRWIQRRCYRLVEALQDASRPRKGPSPPACTSKYNADPHDVPNDDERWVRVRAEPQTLFMRKVRELVNKQPRRVPIAVMVGHPWHYRGLQDPIDGNLRGLLLDVATWANEGLMDAAIPAGYYRPGGESAQAWSVTRSRHGDSADVLFFPTKEAAISAALAMGSRT